MPSSAAQLPEWERLLSAAARLQGILPEAVLVGGTASALHASHRFSEDADHVLPDLRPRFAEVLADLESVAGWRTARTQAPVLILGSLDGIETGVRQLQRQAPLETTVITHEGQPLTIPTLAEILRIKAVLVLRRNATRDYIDFAALADRLGPAALGPAMQPFDSLYPQASGESPLQQLAAQLANPLPFDLDATDLSAYKSLAPRWRTWPAIKSACAQAATQIFDQTCSI